MRETKRSVPRTRQPQENSQKSMFGKPRAYCERPSFLTPISSLLISLLPLPFVPRVLKRLLGGGVLASDAGYRFHVLVGGRAL